MWPITGERKKLTADNQRAGIVGAAAILWSGGPAPERVELIAKIEPGLDEPFERALEHPRVETGKRKVEHKGKSFRFVDHDDMRVRGLAALVVVRLKGKDACLSLDALYPAEVRDHREAGDRTVERGKPD